MSMTHSSYLLDWKTYLSKINGPALNPEKADEWKSAADAIRAFCNPKQIAKMPEWKQELISLRIDDLDELLKPRKKDTLQHIRDLHLLGILWCCVEEGEGYDKAWDLLKECLRQELGKDVGDDLVLGQYWEGSAWEFVPDSFSYQFGFLEDEMLNKRHAKATEMTEARLISALKSLDLKENYPFYESRLEPKEVPWVVDSLHQLHRNLERALKGGFAIFYTLD